MAEREGFEPPLVLPKPVFKTGAINRSAISPGAKIEFLAGLRNKRVEMGIELKENVEDS